MPSICSRCWERCARPVASGRCSACAPSRGSRASSRASSGARMSRESACDASGSNSLRYDVVVIGSGFGGAIAACRLAHAGRSVLVLERGRRWTPDTYPREPDDPWVWDQDKPEACSGWMDLRVLNNMWVAQGAGIGGGSLIYANISIDAKPSAFAAGWPSEISYDAL